VAARPGPSLREVASAHWQTVIFTACFFGLLLVRAYLRISQPDRLDPEREVHDVMKLWVSVGGIIAIVLMSASARRLGRLIGVSSWFNVFVLLKESMGYFEDRRVSVGFLGPRMAGLRETGHKPEKP